jgi:hypothetical protein
MISKRASEILESFPDKYKVFEENKKQGFDKLQRMWDESCKDSFDKSISYEQITIGSAIIEKNIP